MKPSRDGSLQESIVAVQTEVDLSICIRFININLCERRIVVSLRKQPADLMTELPTDPKRKYPTRTIDRSILKFDAERAE